MAETLMKKISGSTAFGANLVTDFASYLGNSNRYITAYVKTFRSELRTASSFTGTSTRIISSTFLKDALTHLLANCATSLFS